jgi:hypothetical protein
MQNSLQTSNLKDRENVAEKRIAFGAATAFALRRALIHNKISDEQPWGLCNRIWTCSEPENQFLGDDLHNRQTGELYAGNGNLWSCGSKLCSSCVAKASNRSRNELTLSLKNQKLFSGESYQFITLTMPNPGLPLLQTRSIMDRAWSLFRKREYFIQQIRGGSKSEEFTITDNGYHYHFHLLCVTRFLSFDKFRHEWTECLRIAFNELNLPCKFNTADGLAMVKIKRLDSSVKGLKGAVLEVCKYVTKSDSWEKISDKDLLDIAAIERFPRMFELFRFFRTQRNVNAILESPNIFVTYLLAQLVTEILKNLVKLIKDGKKELVLEILKKLLHWIKDRKRNTILDTKEINDGENSPGDDEPPDKIPKDDRFPGWRKYIAEFGLEEYLDRLAEQVGRTRDARKCFLKQKYEFAIFRTMDGVSF